MPHLVRERLFIGNIGDAAEVLQDGGSEITHMLSVLSSASISFFSEWRSGLTIPTKEIKKVYVGGTGCDSDSESDYVDGSKSSLSPEKLLYSLEYAGKDLKVVRMAVPLRDMENEDLLDYLNVCYDFIERGRKEGSVLVHCFAGVSRRYVQLSCYHFQFILTTRFLLWICVMLFLPGYCEDTLIFPSLIMHTFSVNISCFVLPGFGFCGFHHKEVLQSYKKRLCRTSKASQI